jgi:hypothetical protein
MTIPASWPSGASRKRFRVVRSPKGVMAAYPVGFCQPEGHEIFTWPVLFTVNRPFSPRMVRAATDAVRRQDDRVLKALAECLPVFLSDPALRMAVMRSARILNPGRPVI